MMGSVAARTIDATRTQHRIVTHRSLGSLIAWASEFASEQADAGLRVLWAPAHTIGGTVSLKTWILHQASTALGNTSEQDAPTLLSGACDVIIVIAPASADSASLHWLSDLMACADAAAEIVAITPLPQIVVLTPTGVSNDAADAFLERLRALGARETRVNDKQAAPSNADITRLVQALGPRNQALAAALALAPIPADEAALDALSKIVGGTGNALKQLTAGELFSVAGGLVVPTAPDFRRVVRSNLDENEIAATAKSVLEWLEQTQPDLHDARIESMIASGDHKRGLRAARKRFDELYTEERFEDALRVLSLVRRYGQTLESGRHAEKVDEAKYAALCAASGQYETARAIVSDLTRKREFYRNAAFVEWLALAARTLAVEVGYEPRNADSLMRRAIRLVGDNLDANVRLTLLRVKLLRSRTFQLEDRASWLLTHVNNTMLDQITPATQAAFLDETAGRLVERGEYKAAFKRLRRHAAIETNQARLARTMLRMARCRAHFEDHEGAHRYASSALHYGVRAANLPAVEDTVRFLREADRGKPKQMPRLTPSRPPTGLRARVPAAAEIPTPQTPEATRLFEVLESRFGAVLWIRRRGGNVITLGKQSAEPPESASVYMEGDDGVITRQAGGKPDANGAYALVLLRADGDDLVVYTPVKGTEPREDAMVRILQADRAVTDTSQAQAPSRKAVVDDYLRRAVAHGTDRGLHATMEMLFNKDLLIYLEEQGLSKEDMAEKLGVSRATLYRMFARAGLN